MTHIICRDQHPVPYPRLGGGRAHRPAAVQVVQGAEGRGGGQAAGHHQGNVRVRPQVSVEDP